MDPNIHPERQNLQQPPQPTEISKPEDMPSNKKNKVFITLGIFILLAVIISAIAGAYFFGKSSSTTSPKIAVTEAENAIEDNTTTVSPSIEPKANWKSFTGKQIPNNALKPYTIRYPDDWELRNEGYPDYDRTRITNNFYTIDIYQAAYGGGGCLFEGEMPNEGIAPGDYRDLEYIEFESNLGLLRRFINPTTQVNDGQTRFSFCYSDDGKFFSAPAIIGIITYIVPINYDEKKLEELDSVIKTISIND